MACNVSIQNVRGFVDGNGEIDRIVVSGTAEDCRAVFVAANCMKPNSTRVEVFYSSQGAVGTWEVTLTYRPGQQKLCHCEEHVQITATCDLAADQPICRDTFEGPLPCGDGGVGDPGDDCPRVSIRVFRNGVEVTEQIRNEVCVQEGRYQFRIESVPPAAISLTVNVDGVEIDLTADPRVSNLAPDNSEFTFSFTEDITLAVYAAVFDPKCGIDQDGIELRCCGCLCPPGTDYNPITQACCPDNTGYNPIARECCPEGQYYNYETRRCEPPGDTPPGDTPPGDTPPDDTHPGDRPPSETHDDDSNGGSFCDCGPWWCYLAGFGLALATGLIILSAANCWSFDSATVQAAIAAIATEGFSAPIALAALEAIGVGVIATAVWRACGSCCVACALLLGAFFGLLLILWQLYNTSTLPPCIGLGVVAIGGVLFMAWAFFNACNSGE